MKLWIRPILVALWVTLAVTIVLAALGIFTIPINNVPLALSILALFALIAQLESFIVLRGINPQWRRVRDDLAITIILSLALLFFVLVLAFILPLLSGSMTLFEFALLLFLTLALLFSIINIAMYYVCAHREDRC